MADIDGTTGNDSLNGTASGDTIDGAGGGDTLNGGAGNDQIYGDSNNLSPRAADTTNTTVANNFQVISLGHFGTDIDPTETGGTSGFSENGGLLNGATYGSTGDPLSGNVVDLVAGTGNGDGQYDGDNTVSNDTFFINGTEYTFDGAAIYDNTIVTFEDGSTATVSAVVFQDTDGNLYLAPEITNNPDTAIYSSQPITSIQLGTQNTSGATGNGLEAARVADSWVENSEVVIGPDGDDVIDGGDGNDTIYGEGGNDSISGGTGDDMLYGDYSESAVIGDDFSNGDWSGSATLNGQQAVFDADNAWTNAVTTTPTGMSSGNGVGGGAQITLDFLWSNGPDPATSGSADFYIDYNGVNYVRITTPTDGTEATISYFNGATGPAGPIPEGNLSGGTGFTTLTFDLPPGIADSGELEFWADTTGGVTDDFAVDNVIVTRDGHMTNSGNDTIDGGAGTDVVDGGEGDDSLDGGTGNDTVIGGTGSDTILLNDGYGGDSITGGEDAGDTDSDVIDASGMTADGVDVFLSGSESGSITSSQGTANFVEIEEFVLTDQDDVFSGANSSTGVNVDGRGGNDSLVGGSGNDTLLGSAGDDTLDGGAGNDTIHGDTQGVDPPVGTALQGGTPLQINETTTGFQSPPITTVLDNGQVAYVWIDDAADNDGLTLTPQIRIANADGTWATNQVELSDLWAVDGFDGYDWDNMDVDLLPDGNLVISYVRNTSEAGDDEPVFSIIDPSALGTPGQYVLTNQEIQSSDTTTIESPPITTVLDNGNVLFVWSKNGSSDDTPTMELQGRIFDPTTNTFVTSDFRISDIAVDGTDSADVDNLDIVQLSGGNVVVSWVRSNVEAGGSEPVFTVLDQDGNSVSGTIDVQQVDDTTWESPADIVALDNGNWMAVWIDNGYSDDTATMVLEGRIFDASGNPVTGDFQISNDAVDGFDGYDVPNFSATVLGNGNVVVGFVESSVSGGTDNSPQFSIVAPDGSIVAQDIEIAQNTTHPWPGPPVIEAIGDTGHFVAVYAEGNNASGGNTALNYRIYDGQGNPVTNETELTNATDGSALSGSDAFDWSQVDVDYNAFNNTFTVSWVGANDGSGTGAYTSGPIAGIPRPPVEGNDSLSGGDGTDVVDGGGGDDRLDGGTGNDTVSGGTGSDTILLNDGYGGDSITGGEDAGDTDRDVIDASGMTADGVDVFLSGSESGSITSSQGTANFVEVEEFVLTDQDDVFRGANSSTGVNVDGRGGNDSLVGGTGNDTLSGGAGDDTLRGGDGTDSLSGGDGDDVLFESFGTSTLDGGAGSDRFEVGFGTSTIIGGDTGSNVDTLSAVESNDPISVSFGGTGFGTYDDLSDSDSGTFTGIEAVEGSSGADSIDGSLDSGGLQLSGNAGDDTIIGGSGNDTLDGGTGNDSLTGGLGNDVFTYTPGDGLDTISDFNAGNTGPLGDADSTNNDFIDLSGYYDHLFELWADQADDGILNQSNTTDTQGNAVSYADNTQFSPGEGIVFQGATASSNFFTTDNTAVVCFASGTLILTDRGEVPVERLRVDDRIVTYDNGLQPLAMVASRRLGPEVLARNPNLKPIEIKPGALGGERRLVVSPQHMMLVLQDGEETLVRARQLSRLKGGAVRVMKGCSKVTYYHLIFDAHQIVFANGRPAESFFPGPRALAALDLDAQREFRLLFPDINADLVGAKEPRGWHTARNGTRTWLLPDAITGVRSPVLHSVHSWEAGTV